MSDVLVLATDPDRFGPAAKYAADLVARLGGSLTAMYAAQPLPVPPQVESGPLATEIREMEQERYDAALRAEHPFRDWVRSQGIGRCAWHAIEAPILPALESAAPWHDLIVLERSASGDPASQIGPLLLRTRLPCIVVAAGAEPHMRTIAVAWNGSPESIRALHASLPLLRRAERVVLLRGARPEPPASARWSPAGDVAQYLEWQGIRADSVPIVAMPERAGAAILAAADAEGADLLVMGAYGRTRFSEWFLGGVTRHALEHAHIPLFLRH